MLSRSNFSRASKLLCTEARKIPDSSSPPTISPSSVHTEAAAISRAWSESSLGAIFTRRLVGGLQAIAQPAHRLDQIGVELLAQASDEDLDRVGVAVEI